MNYFLKRMCAMATALSVVCLSAPVNSESVALRGSNNVPSSDLHYSIKTAGQTTSGTSENGITTSTTTAVVTTSGTSENSTTTSADLRTTTTTAMVTTSGTSDVYTTTSTKSPSTTIKSYLF